MRAWSALIFGLMGASLLPATTLEQLSLGDMIQKSTGIVHAKVTGSYAAYQGADIWTYYQLQVMEDWKPSGQVATEVDVPGGAAKGVRQSVAGAPVLTVGGEYVLFLWTSRSGITQIIGLSQGLFSVRQDASGNSVVSRPAAAELMLDQNGRVVQDQPVGLALSDLRSQVLQALGAGK